MTSQVSKGGGGRDEKQKPTAAKAKPAAKAKTSPVKPAQKHGPPAPEATASPDTVKATQQVVKRVRGKQGDQNEKSEIEAMKEAPYFSFPILPYLYPKLQDSEFNKFHFK